MKRTLSIVALTLVGMVAVQPHCFAEWITRNDSFYKDLPRQHWAYSCLPKMASFLGYEKEMQAQSGRLMAPIEFAVYYNRANTLLLQKPELIDPTIKDVMAAFRQEFVEEIACLNSPDPSNYYPKGSEPRVAAPPRLTIAPSIGKPGYNGYTYRKFLNPKEVENFKKEAEKTEVPAK